MKTSQIESLFENLINGNLTEAKRMAKRHTAFRLSMFARQVLCWDFDRSCAAAAYLKGLGTFQEYCDTEASGVRYKRVNADNYANTLATEEYLNEGPR